MIPRGQWLRILTRDGWKCQKCGRNLEEEGAQPQVGHKLAKSLGGKSTDDNLRAECGACNQGSGNGLGGSNPQIVNNRGRNWWIKAGGKTGGFFSLLAAQQSFACAYRTYPVHIGYDAAEREWRNAVVRLAESEAIPLGDAADRILEQIRLYALSDSGRRDGLRRNWVPPYLSTWLKNGQFRDDPKEWNKHDTEGICASVAGEDDF